MVNMADVEGGNSCEPMTDSNYVGPEARAKQGTVWKYEQNDEQVERAEWNVHTK